VEIVDAEYLLVPTDPSKRLSSAKEFAVKVRLLEMPPARRVTFVGRIAYAIHIVGPVGKGVGPDIAPAILADVAEHAGTPIRLTTDEPHE
jgi:hypothetical protein